VSHDLAVVASLADRVAVMYAGRLVEKGPAEALFEDAGHPYTRRLLAAVPDLRRPRALEGIPGRAPSPGSRPTGCSFAPRCLLAIDECRAAFPPEVALGPAHSARCIRTDVVRGTARVDSLPATGTPVTDAEPVLAASGLRIRYGSVEVVHGVDLQLAQRECLAVVGESGSGKTTLARTLAGLHSTRDGDLTLHGSQLAPSARGRSREERRRVQYVFQNPYGSLNPRLSVGDSVRRPLRLLGVDGAEARRRVDAMLERVSLDSSYTRRYPDQLSGGERQRVAIARALVCEPEVLICDEVTSALDVSVQAAVVDLLAELQRDLGLSMLFVTHNLPLVRAIAHRVAVMQDGRFVETGPVAQVVDEPQAEYTRRLLEDTPQIEPAAG
jgi:peptide/nickel transport system ATP-binding protein